jgi:hypothetical protein
VSSPGGVISARLNAGSWQRQRLMDGWFAARDVGYGNGHFVTVGWTKYRDSEGFYTQGQEIAQIFRATDPAGEWDMMWSSAVDNSIIYRVRYLAGMWVAVGHQASLPLLLISYDNAVTWQQVDLPAGFTASALYDVDVITRPETGIRTWYFASNGAVLHATDGFPAASWAHSTTLHGPDGLATVQCVRGNDLGQLVAASSQCIWYSADGINWISYATPAYDPRSVAWFNDQWVVSGESLLTSTTYWTSQDGLAWTAANNGVQATVLIEA